jgi:very-short-patch-repair endonuclease
MGLRKPKCIENSCYIYNHIWSNKNDLLPEMVSKSSDKKFIFNCLNCSHEYEQSPASKLSGSGCPYCSNKKRCGSCEHCLDNSCYRYKVIWSVKNKEKCEYIAIGSAKKFIFNCLKCSHEYEQSPSKKMSGRGCPYCVNKLRCGECEKCLENSCFIYKKIWSDKNKQKCEEVALSSGKKFIFNCLNCGHEYEQRPNDKTNQGLGCPYCDNKLRCGKCYMCLENSCFIYKKLWSDKNNEECEHIALNCHKKFIFNCDICRNEYEQSPHHKTKGVGCPYCINKTELKVADFLKEENIKFISQFSFENIKKYYDFYLPDFNLILEIDGNQHFKQVSNWGCHEENVNNDVEKMKTGLAKSISFLRIYQPDIWGNKIDWKTIITKNLYKRTFPDITYVSSKTDIYNIHDYIFSCIE